MLHGCIPVFVGPPWHSLPFFQELDYPTFSLFFHVASYSQWVDQEAAVWLLDLWDLDADVGTRMKHVQELSEIEVTLRAIPKHEVVSLQMALSVARPAFLWKRKFDDYRPSVTTTAVDLILRRLCPTQEFWEPIPRAEFWRQGVKDASLAHKDMSPFPHHLMAGTGVRSSSSSTMT